MTIREKSKCWIEANYGSNDREMAIDSLDLLLRQQDRDTRHACARACISVVNGDGQFKLPAEVFHDVCMNVKSDL